MIPQRKISPTRSETNTPHTANDPYTAVATLTARADAEGVPACGPGVEAQRRPGVHMEEEIDPEGVAANRWIQRGRDALLEHEMNVTA
jgi:hypothetical protein